MLNCNHNIVFDIFCRLKQFVDRQQQFNHLNHAKMAKTVAVAHRFLASRR